MVLVRYDIDIFSAAVIEICHEGDDYPGPDRRHLLQVLPWLSGLGGIYGAQIWAQDLPTAEILIQHVVRLPALIQDICNVCRGCNRGPNRPRFNIYRGEEPRILTPCFIEDWV